VCTCSRRTVHFSSRSAPGAQLVADTPKIMRLALGAGKPTQEFDGCATTFRAEATSAPACSSMSKRTMCDVMVSKCEVLRSMDVESSANKMLEKVCKACTASPKPWLRLSSEHQYAVNINHWTACRKLAAILASDGRIIAEVRASSQSFTGPNEAQLLLPASAARFY
jgi:hypothetical protein